MALKIFPTLLFSVVFATLFAQKNNAFFKENEKVNFGKSSFKFSLPLLSNCNAPIITAKINGKDYNFVLSTSLDYSLINKSLAKALNVSKPQKAKVWDKKLPYTTIAQLQIEGFEINNATFIISNEIDDSSMWGFIGTDILSKLSWQLDLNNKVITVASHWDSLQFSKNKRVIPFYNYSEQTVMPYVHLQRGQNFFSNAIIDSEFNGTLSFSKPIFKAFYDTLPHYQLNILKFDNKKNQFYKDSTIWLCPKGLNLGGNVPIEMAWTERNNSNAIIIGNKFLKNYSVSFDWKNHLLILDNPRPSEKERLPIYLTYYQNKVIVVELVKGAKAQKSGVALNDEVLEINGENIEGITEADFNKLFDELQVKQTKHWKLTLRNQDNKIKNVIVEKEKYSDLFFFD